MLRSCVSLTFGKYVRKQCKWDQKITQQLRLEATSELRYKNHVRITLESCIRLTLGSYFICDHKLFTAINRKYFNVANSLITISWSINYDLSMIKIYVSCKTPKHLKIIQNTHKPSTQPINQPNHPQTSHKPAKLPTSHPQASHTTHKPAINTQLRVENQFMLPQTSATMQSMG